MNREDMLNLLTVVLLAVKGDKWDAKECKAQATVWLSVAEKTEEL